jgi:hypothetical protein
VTTNQIVRSERPIFSAQNRSMYGYLKNEL